MLTNDKATPNNSASSVDIAESLTVVAPANELMQPKPSQKIASLNSLQVPTLLKSDIDLRRIVQLSLVSVLSPARPDAKVSRAVVKFENNLTGTTLLEIKSSSGHTHFVVGTIAGFVESGCCYNGSAFNVNCIELDNQISVECNGSAEHYGNYVPISELINLHFERQSIKEFDSTALNCVLLAELLSNKLSQLSRVLDPKSAQMVTDNRLPKLKHQLMALIHLRKLEPQQFSSELLIVDDNPENLKAARQVFPHAMTAGSESEARELIQKYRNSLKIIITDQEMDSEASGYRLARFALFECGIPTYIASLCTQGAAGATHLVPKGRSYVALDVPFGGQHFCLDSSYRQRTKNEVDTWRLIKDSLLASHEKMQKQVESLGNKLPITRNATIEGCYGTPVQQSVWGYNLSLMFKNTAYQTSVQRDAEDIAQLVNASQLVRDLRLQIVRESADGLKYTVTSSKPAEVKITNERLTDRLLEYSTNVDFKEACQLIALGKEIKQFMSRVFKERRAVSLDDSDTRYKNVLLANDCGVIHMINEYSGISYRYWCQMSWWHEAIFGVRLEGTKIHIWPIGLGSGKYGHSDENEFRTFHLKQISDDGELFYTRESAKDFETIERTVYGPMGGRKQICEVKSTEENPRWVSLRKKSEA